MAYKMIMVVLAIVLMSWTTTQAQVPPTSGTCLQALVPCQPFLSSPTPPKVCCDPLKNAVKNDLACLCAAFTNPALAATFNMTQAMMLPINCGIKNAGPSMCKPGGISSPPTSSPGPTSSSTPSPPTTTTPTLAPPPKGNGAGRSISLAGPVYGVMLLVAGLMFC